MMTVAAVLMLVGTLSGPATAEITAAAGTGGASSPALDAIVSRLQRRYDSMRSFRASFVEELSSPGGMKRSRKGTVFFKKVGLMRWEFDAPSKATVVSDGKMMYDYEQDLNQVVEVPVTKALKTNATAFLLGLGNVKRDFHAALPAAASADGLVHVVLVPKGGGDKIELGLNPKTYDIDNFKLTNQIGGVTRLTFSDIQTNVAIKNSLFRFKIPDGADIVRPQ